jgi:hypothetical protein
MNPEDMKETNEKLEEEKRKEEIKLEELRFKSVEAKVNYNNSLHCRADKVLNNLTEKQKDLIA